MRQVNRNPERGPDEVHEVEIAGIDTLEIPVPPHRRLVSRIWIATWPKIAAAAILLGLWQIVVWTHWKPRYVLPGPGGVFPRIRSDLLNGSLVSAARVTMARAAMGFGIALVVGAVLGIGVSRFQYLRRAVGALITGFQTMPSIAWFPLAILLFQLSERAILLVVVLGAAPSIANGIVAGIDHIPRVLLRAGRILGARGLSSLRRVVIPAAIPSFIGGLKQGWAFAWRSLMAGELIVIIANRPSLGVKLQLAREFSDAEGLLAAMMVILVIGLLVDLVVFTPLDSTVRRRWGLVEGSH